MDQGIRDGGEKAISNYYYRRAVHPHPIHIFLPRILTVQRQVAHSLNDEIRRLSILVDEFDRPFHPDPLVLAVYKKELHQWVEQGLGRNLSNRCNTALLQSLQVSLYLSRTN